jgi:hypothetical protein
MSILLHYGNQRIMHDVISAGTVMTQKAARSETLRPTEEPVLPEPQLHRLINGGIVSPAAPSREFLKLRVASLHQIPRLGRVRIDTSTPISHAERSQGWYLPASLRKFGTGEAFMEPKAY